jgi:hypothetical protein
VKRYQIQPSSVNTSNPTATFGPDFGMCLRVLKEALQRCEYEECSRIRHRRYFKDLGGRLKWENVVEMFGILMERECETIRRKKN